MEKVWNKTGNMLMCGTSGTSRYRGLTVRGTSCREAPQGRGVWGVVSGRAQDR